MSTTFRHTIVWAFLLTATASAQVSQWQFNKAGFRNGVITDAIGGYHGRLEGRPCFLKDQVGEFLELDEVSGAVHVGRYPEDVSLPAEQISVEAVARFRRFGDYVGVIGAFQDNGDYERGWVLGVRHGRPFFALASEGAKSLTYLTAGEQIDAGKWYHLVGTYDGRVLRLFVNGRLALESTAQRGKILYPERA